jgi:SpoVK/Ycf46/Vps4 family AAA+-type ATPase
MKYFFLDLPREEEREEIFKIIFKNFDQIVGNYLTI